PTSGYRFDVVMASQAGVPVTFTDTLHSDSGMEPIPSDAHSDPDQHVLVVQTGTCKLFELVQATKDTSGPGWSALAGATYGLGSSALHRDCSSTSTNAGGLPLFPGLVRYDETMGGEIRHALHFTVMATQAAFVHPATNFASSNTDSNLPPLGLRVRLRKDFDT